MIVFAEERLVDAWPELNALALAHWQETEMYRHGEGFNPQIERYIQYNDMGYYHLYTVREDGRLIGDAGVYIMPSMHTGKLIANEDTWFLVPEARKGRNAIRFYKFIEDEVKKLGAVEFSVTTKLTNQVGRLVEYLGYTHVANHHSKRL